MTTSRRNWIPHFGTPSFRDKLVWKVSFSILHFQGPDTFFGMNWNDKMCSFEFLESGLSYQKFCHFLKTLQIWCEFISLFIVKMLNFLWYLEELINKSSSRIYMYVHILWNLFLSFGFISIASSCELLRIFRFRL